MKKKFFIIILLLSGVAVIIVWSTGQFTVNQQTKKIFENSEQNNHEKLDASQKNSKRLTLNDLPADVANFFIYESVLKCLSMSEMELLKYLLNKYDNNLTAEDKNLLKQYIRFCSKALTLFNKKDLSVKVSSGVSSESFKIGDDAITLYDPRHIVMKINQIKLDQTFFCNQFKQIPDNHWHNFLVYYMCNIRLHKQFHTYIDIKSIHHPIKRQFFSIFTQKDYYVSLDRFLQQFGFRKDTASRGEFWTVLYFDYLYRAFEKGYVNMVLRQFLEGLDSLVNNRFPEVKYLRNYLIIMQREKLIQ